MVLNRGNYMKTSFLIMIFFCGCKSFSMERSEYEEKGCLLERTCVICGERGVLGSVYFSQLTCGHFVHTKCFQGGSFYCSECRAYVRKSIDLCLTADLLKLTRSKDTSKMRCCFCFKKK
jgi:hypothetical protein